MHSPLRHGPTLRDDIDTSSSDDSTQPPDVIFEIEFPKQVETTGSLMFVSILGNPYLVCPCLHMFLHIYSNEKLCVVFGQFSIY